MDNSTKPPLLHAEPVLAVSNISETVAYWHEVLCFPDKWMWGDPPNHGGVSWHGGAFIQFGLNPELAARSQGHSVWIRARNLEALYELHQEKKTNIVSPLNNKPWGFAEYTVQDINGYYIHFSAPAADHAPSSQHIPDIIRITKRTPTAEEYNHLCLAVGWADKNDKATMLAQLRSNVFAVVAENRVTDEIVGCAFLVGDDSVFYYIKDVIVHPHWQNKRIGTALMQAIMEWLKANAADKATVGLFTGEHLAAFYRQFGFIETCGMYQQLRLNIK